MCLENCLPNAVSSYPRDASITALTKSRPEDSGGHETGPILLRCDWRINTPFYVLTRVSGPAHSPAFIPLPPTNNVNLNFPLEIILQGAEAKIHLPDDGGW